MISHDWIRTSRAFDRVIDFERAVRDPENPQQIRAEFASDDRQHANDAGDGGGDRDLRLFDQGPAKRGRAATQ